MNDDGSRQRPPGQVEKFEQQASARPTGLISEFVAFLRYNKKWWLVPIIVLLLLMGAILILGATGAAPFIYTLQ